LTDGKKVAYDQSYYKSDYFHILQHKYDEDFYDYSGTAKFASLRNNEIVLEVGCGLGTLSWVLSKYSDYVIGADISKFAVHWGKKNYRSQRGKEIDFVVASGTHLPFRENSIDCIVCSHFFEHLYEKDAVKTQKECARVLAKLGRMVVMQPFEAQRIRTFPQFVLSFFYRIVKGERIDIFVDEQRETTYSGHPEGRDTSHKRFYTLDTFVQEMEKSGFTITQYHIDLRKRAFTRIIWRFLSSTLGRKAKRKNLEIDLVTRYIKLYLRAPYFLRKMIFIPFKPKIMAHKIS